MKPWLLCLFFLSSAVSVVSHAHDKTGQALYMANEAVMVSSGETRIMFDPFFATGFGTYAEVPGPMMAQVMAQQAPFDGVDAIFISHVHGDHFDGKKVHAYLQVNRTVKIYLPEQGASYLREAAGEDGQILERIIAFALAEGDPPKIVSNENLEIGAVRIPHSGWPTGRRDVNNIAFRVTLEGGVTVMHMGDADVNDVHYALYDDHWQERATDLAMPPYWMVTSRTGQKILTQRLNVKEAIGIHVPKKRPMDLLLSGEDYFYEPGDTREIGTKE